MSIRNPEHIYYKVVSLDTGEEIQQCVAADDATGEYIVNILPGSGDNTGFSLRVEQRKGKIKLVDTRQ